MLGNLIKSSFLFSSLFELLSVSDISGLSVLISSIVGSIGLFTSIDGFSCSTGLLESKDGFSGSTGLTASPFSSPGSIRVAKLVIGFIP